jgi:hypothetical protein
MRKKSNMKQLVEDELLITDDDIPTHPSDADERADDVDRAWHDDECDCKLLRLKGIVASRVSKTAEKNTASVSFRV